MGLLTNTMISVVIMGLVASGFMIFYVNGVDKYSPTDYDDEKLVVIQAQLDSMSKIGNDTRTSIQQFTQPQNAFDVVGGIFNTGFNIMKTPIKTFDILFTTMSVGVDSIPGIGEYSNILIGGLTTIFVLIIFVGIMLSIMIKSDKI